MIPNVKILHIICVIGMLTASDCRSVKDDDGVATAVTGMQTLGINVINKLAELYPEKSIALSPLSLHTAGAMTLLGAAGQTAKEIAKGFHLPDLAALPFAQTYNNLLKPYSQTSSVKMANKVYVKSGYSLAVGYEYIMQRFLFSSIESLSFKENMKSAKTINTWVEQKTKIKDLVKPDSLDEDTRLVLVNVLSFQGNWNKSFDVNETETAKFYLDEYRTTLVPMMFQNAEFPNAILEDLDAQVLELPYKEDDLSMLIILPRARTGLANLLKKLAKTKLDAIVGKLKSSNVIVKLPKFKSEFSVDLKEPLQQMGVRNMFSNKADFSGMLQSREDLKISSIVHKVFVDVNEVGTEAAAATSVAAITLYMLDDNEFNADHPFFYAIRSKRGDVLFEGIQTFQ